jgi:hypothetical protein
MLLRNIYGIIFYTESRRDFDEIRIVNSRIPTLAIAKYEDLFLSE